MGNSPILSHNKNNPLPYWLKRGSVCVVRQSGARDKAKTSQAVRKRNNINVIIITNTPIANPEPNY